MLKDLMEAILTNSQKGDAILLGLDTNGELETDKDLALFLHQCDLYDLFKSLPGGKDIPHTYKFLKR